MKKKIIITITVLPFLIFGIVILNGLVRYKSHFKSMNPTVTSQINGSIYAIKTDYVNSYIIDAGEGGYISIDSGLDKNSLENELEKVKLNPDNITHVFLTHTDYDHVGGISLYKNAQVHILGDEKTMIDGETVRAPFMKNSLERSFTTVDNGDIINIGDITIEAIRVKGHTLGSVCYKVNDKHLFTGDTIKVSETGGEIFIPDFNMDNKLLKESLKVLGKHKNVEMIFTGHHGYNTNPAKIIEDVIKGDRE